MKITWKIDNIKCNGCAENVAKALLMIDGLADVEVDTASKCVSFDADDKSALEAAERALTRAGYPPQRNSE